MWPPLPLLAWVDLQAQFFSVGGSLVHEDMKSVKPTQVWIYEPDGDNPVTLVALHENVNYLLFIFVYPYVYNQKLHI